MTLHLRFDDSRLRHLASQCTCGVPGCLEWHWDAVAIANDMRLKDFEAYFGNTKLDLS